MQTTTTASTLQMTLNENPASPDHPECFRTTLRKSRETDWDKVIKKADRLIAGAGAVAVALSALYFASILVSMLLKE